MASSWFLSSWAPRLDDARAHGDARVRHDARAGSPPVRLKTLLMAEYLLLRSGWGKFPLRLPRAARLGGSGRPGGQASPALVAGPTLTGPHVRLCRPMAGQRGRGQAGEPTAFPGQVGLIGIACFGREDGQVKDGRAGVDA